MSLQYVSDNTGKTTGVFIPIEEWNALKNRFKGIEELDIPNWQLKEVRQRVEDYNKTGESLSFDEAMTEIENSL